jgi:hypothetical protein
LIWFTERFGSINIIFGGVEVEFIDVGRVEMEEVHVIVMSLALTAVILGIGVGLFAFFFDIHVDVVLISYLGF